MLRRTFAFAIRCVLPVITFFITAAIASAAPIFYGVSGSNLLRFDMGAQTATIVAPLMSGGSPLTVMEDCDFDATGNLWAMRQGSLGGFPPTQVSQAYTVDITTGNAVPQGNYGSNAALQSLAFRPSNSAFYSVNQAGGTTTGHLVTSDLAAGTVTTVAGVPHGLPGQLRVDALAFSPGGTLYGICDSNPGGPFGSPNYKLVSFNLSSGLGSVIGSIGSSAQAFVSLRFDSAGVAYTVDANSGNVFTLNLTTGQGTLLFAGGAAAIGTRGLAFIPEPATAAFLALGALMSLRHRRR